MVLTKDNTAAIKGFAILCMVWHHLFLSTAAYGEWAHYLSIFGKVCVALFLFVSGYGLTIQYDKINDHTLKNTVGFLLKRYAKFFMAYWFCMLTVMVVGNLSGYTFAVAYPPQRNHLKCFLFDCFGWMGYESYINTWWFNKLIIQLYLIFPVLFLLLKNKYVRYLSLVAILVIEQFSLIPVFPIIEGGLCAFFIGMLAAKVKGGYSEILHDKKILVVAIVGLTVFVFLRFVCPSIRYSIIDGCVALCIGFIISVVSKNYSFPVLRFFGKYATIMYLTHTLFHKVLYNTIYFTNFAPAIFITLLAISLIAAIAIQKLQELTRYDRLESSFVSHINRVFS